MTPLIIGQHRGQRAGDFGGGFALRTIITLTLNAIQYFGKAPIDAVFVRDEAEARSWVDARRTALASEVKHGE